MELNLSERQRTAVAAALTIVATAVILCAIGAVAWLASAFVREFSAVFLPLAVAAVLALVFHPEYEWLSARMPKALALVVVFLSILVPFVAFGWFFGEKLVGQVADLIRYAPELWGKIAHAAQERWPSIRTFFQENALGMRITEAMKGQEGTLLSALQVVGKGALGGVWGFLKGIGALFAWAVTPVYFAFFLMADPRGSGKKVDLATVLPFLKEETRNDVVYLIQEFVDILVAFFRGQLIIAFFQGVLFAIGFSVVGLKYGLVLGLALGFLNIIPYLGSIVGLSIGLPLAMFQPGGGVKTVVAVLITFTVVQMIEGYVLTPRIMGEQHRPAPDGDHRLGVLLGCGARRHHGHDPGHPADRLPGRLLAPRQREVHRGDCLARYPADAPAIRRPSPPLAALHLLHDASSIASSARLAIDDDHPPTLTAALAGQHARRAIRWCDGDVAVAAGHQRDRLAHLEAGASQRPLDGLALERAHPDLVAVRAAVALDANRHDAGAMTLGPRGLPARPRAIDDHVARSGPQAPEPRGRRQVDPEQTAGLEGGAGAAREALELGTARQVVEDLEGGGDDVGVEVGRQREEIAARDPRTLAEPGEPRACGANHRRRQVVAAHVQAGLGEMLEECAGAATDVDQQPGVGSVVRDRRLDPGDDPGAVSTEESVVDRGQGGVAGVAHEAPASTALAFFSIAAALILPA